ncbi:Erythromycin esterase homolog [Nakamurella panacisegetis]|uniref:Erythromycin esterase homolog n=1 Tax=Nakamurella panacisegetis TaxID=1090615 RepID=A0A1H0LT35_9ACTN|nr:erythromycin esterase family protein [Nakamurella panacisegetis]SDO71273.1 Erythromycin esterase homolog [Nakamurella panacisegetis]
MNSDRRPDAEIRSLATPLARVADLSPLVRRAGQSRFVCVGEASHGTHEYYRWRALLSRRLIQEEGFTWIGVEGDWPDCWRINRWVRGHADQELTAPQLLAGFERWPTWMWANHDVAEFLTWLRTYNLARPEPERVGFYGLDVYSLWDSLWQIMTWLETNAPDAVSTAMRAWQCFLPYGEDPQRYAWSTRLVPNSCESEIVSLLVQVRRQTRERMQWDEDAFDAAQNAEVAADAEHYYRTMVRGDRQSWNIRDHHMTDTVGRIAEHLGPNSKGLVWEHNTHVGDARATDMAQAGLVNVGQLLRERYPGEVMLIGFAGYRGTVLAAGSWAAPEQAFTVPDARPDTHEGLLHDTLHEPAVLLFGEERSGPWLSRRLGHRAIGVVYDPTRESGNYVPTRIGERYDALLWLEETTALQPLHHEPQPLEPELATEPTGF